MSATLRYNAVILAGGRSTRLGGTPKALLLAGDRTLLETTLAAVPEARQTAVAGPPELAAVLARHPETPTLLVREEPAFAGPAAAVGAAVAALTAQDAGRDPRHTGNATDDGDTAGSPWTLVLACDMPQVSTAVRALLTAAAEPGNESLLAVDSTGNRQPLAALYRTADLRAAVDAAASEGLANKSMKALLARVQWRGVDVPPMSTADVDTWNDAQSLGVSAGDLP
ncbi:MULTISPECIES: NTP transferase domain-containing protein [unclassified Arthrobacter]|uniref:molybdenum cofactor guanylyltransferase n=1 Tax=unclassified Arthrobacter TaxID=235627 RepID=UPI001E5D33B8|nr:MULTISPECIES: NTP transferase domain-containing protein [unclassified Arthrobacter]MCC9145847.1 NTP transferase domain-containing protein [Arthrobacter sp. zg-Y919]MDK1277076.1 NTP transferase domain-containing protein [Arthrobacter sp. zg.Y919]WIB03601.1 NTP transferase domain-containing protein [Arthrobacter sp. zg-Y919]